MNDKEIRVDFGGPCVFCGQPISESETDPCRVTVETAPGLWQLWYCHAKCFRAVIVDDPMLEPAHF